MLNTKNLDKLWRVWQSGNIELCLLLIQSQGLDLSNTLIEFWDNQVVPESRHHFKNIKVTNYFNINITYNSEDNYYIVWSNIDSIYKLFYEKYDYKNTKKEAFNYFTETLNTYIK